VSADVDLSAKPIFDFDAAVVGDEYGPLEYTLTPEKLELYRRAIGDPEAVFATIASKDYANLLRTRYTLGEVVNARHETRYHRPPEVGDRVRITGRLVDRFVKRERPFIVVETISTDAAGEVLVESRTTLALGRPKAGG
jgi:hypothetical protein